MKRSLSIVLCAAFLLSAGAFAADVKFVQPEQNMDLPSFLGWVENEFIVVLNQDIDVDHGKDQASRVALASVPGFDDLRQRFLVTHLRPLFPGADRNAQSASDLGQSMARHYKVIFDAGTLDEAMAAYAANPAVDHVEPIGMHTLSATPNDPYYQGYPNPNFLFDQWHYYGTHSVHANTGWDMQTGQSTVKVGILDSGVRYFHLDLGGDSPQWGPSAPFAGGNIFINPGEIPGNGVDDDGNGYVDDVIGWDFVATTGGIGVTCIDQDCGGADNNPDDGNGHGTHVAGTVSAITNNGILVAGVAGGYSAGTRSDPGTGVEVIPCRIGYHASYRGMVTGIVHMDYAAQAMYYIANLKDAGHNVAAINCSWGSSNSGGIAAATDYLLARDVVVVVAAGNSNSTSASYLSSRGDCFDVAATDKNGAGASFTNYGSWVDIAAPGVEILSTYANPDDPDLTAHYIAVLDGTSMAAPHVAGCLALLESCNPSLTASQKVNLLKNNASPYSDSRYLGTGIANVYAALSAAGCSSGPTLPVANFSGSPTSGNYPLTVQFTDLSSGSPTSWSWNFGDGVGTSTAQNPSYTYQAAGTYTVSLTVTNSAGSDTETKTNYISVTAPSAPVANFSGTPTSGNYPLAVQFSDLSSGSPTSWSWNFGDGVGTSTVQNPSYTYQAAGTYTVSLTATNAYGSDTETKVDYITVTEPPVAGTMHVHNIVVTRKMAGPNCSGIGTIYIYDANEQPVANATVYISATGPTSGTGSGTTGSNGAVSFETAKTRSCGGEWCFEVTNVTHASNTYYAAGNHVTKACESGWVYGVGDPIVMALPNEFGLAQNYPNPFNPTTEIAFSLPSAMQVRLEVYNVAGQQVAVLVDGTFGAGRHQVTWDASKQSSGIYLYRLVAGDKVDTRKMILMK